MKYLVLLLLTFFLSLNTRGQALNYHKDYERILGRSRDKADSIYYDKLLPRFLDQDSTLSVKEMLYLMIGYTGRPDFKPYQELETEKLVYRLNNEGQYKEVVMVSDTFLARHPLNQAVIIEKAYAFHQLNRKDSAAFYKEQFGRIMAAMDWSNSGRTPEEAIFSIGPQDGQNFIDKYYRADLGRSGSDEDKEGNFCNLWEMKFNKEGKPQSVFLYFAIQHAVNTTAPSTPNNITPPK